MRTTLLLTLTLAAACGDDKNDPTATGSGTEGSSSGGPTTSASTTSSTTNPTDNSGSMSDGQTMGGTTEMTSVGPTATSDATAVTASSGSSTGGGGGEIPAACLDVCNKGVSECMIGDLGPTVELCAEDCSGELGGAMGACADATVAFLACLAGLECAALEDAIVNDNFGPCLDAGLELESSCSTGDCTTEVAGGDMGTACSLTITCPDTPQQVMQCEGKQCVCLVGDQMMGMCPAMDICMTPELLEEKAADCCGF